MPVRKDIRFDLDKIAHNPLDGKMACVDLGIDAFNDDSSSSICWFCHALAGYHLNLTQNLLPHATWKAKTLNKKMRVLANTFVAF